MGTTGSRGRRRTKPHRYQLTKEGVGIVKSGHPWIFRRRISSAAGALADGQWLRLVDGANQVAGFGFYHEEGAIAIRVVRKGPEPPGPEWIRATLRSALDRRRELRRGTDAFRAVHGENDGLPALAVDVYGSIAVVSSYARGADPLGRLVSRYLRSELALDGILWRPGSRRLDTAPGARVLHGHVPPLVSVHEDGHRIAVAPSGGQKSGSFLDLRGLRRRLRQSELSGRRVLDLFSYTGSLGAAAEAGGASEIWHVEASRAALDFGREHHCQQASRHRFIEADVFEWLPRLDPEERFDVVLVDPPQMTSRASQLKRVLGAYDRLYRAASRHVREGGLLVACCCTSRVDAETFRAAVRGALGRDFRFVERLDPEPDHPVSFGQADYLKILFFRRKQRERLRANPPAA
jgi:23S rRNA G2069 N7-methylase RlmK/C1962 C5-methylase RlmI